MGADRLRNDELVTYDEGRVGYVDGDEIVRLDVPTMREWFERGGADETGERVPLADARLRAPIVPKKFFHTAGNFREHEEDSKVVNWSHEIAPWIVFFQNVDAIVGPDEPVVYPEHLTEELDYELELAVVLKQAGKWFPPEEAMDYVGGYVIFNDITARDIQRREMRSGVFSFCKAIDTFCPLGPWIVTPDEIPDPHDLAMELRVNGESRQVSHSGNMSTTIAEILSHYSALGYSAGDVLSTGTVSGVAGFSEDAASLYLKPGRRDRGGDRADRRPPQPGDRLGGGARRAAAGARAVVVGSVELVPLVDAVGLLGELEELYPGFDDWDPYRALYPELFAGSQWRVPCTSYLIRSGGKTVLVDTGVGPAGLWGWTPEREEGLLPGLAAEGVAPDEIDVVFLTHLHVDHVGWNTDRDGRLVFPKARYVAHRDGVAFALGSEQAAHRAHDRAGRVRGDRAVALSWPTASRRSSCAGTSPGIWACGSSQGANARC